MVKRHHNLVKIVSTCVALLLQCFLNPYHREVNDCFKQTVYEIVTRRQGCWVVGEHLSLVVVNLVACTDIFNAKPARRILAEKGK